MLHSLHKLRETVCPRENMHVEICAGGMKLYGSVGADADIARLQESIDSFYEGTLSLSVENC